MLDEHGYPTEEALEKIKEWPDDDMPGLMAFVKELWWMPDWGWREEITTSDILDKPVIRYSISTGGWNSIGMGKSRGYEIVEILMVCHGRAHNDTLCVVDRKSAQMELIQ